jgi:glycine/D-amino acid oxidase-like deaminating enzyme
MVVVGGGLLITAIAYEAARAGAPVILFDKDDIAHRASRGNSGLVWMESKGDTSPRYVRWTRGRAKFWPALAKELLELTGVDVALRQSGGFHICFNAVEMQTREAVLGIRTGILIVYSAVPSGRF